MEQLQVTEHDFRPYEMLSEKVLFPLNSELHKEFLASLNYIKQQNRLKDCFCLKCCFSMEMLRIHEYGTLLNRSTHMFFFDYVEPLSLSYDPKCKGKFWELINSIFQSEMMQFC